MPNWPSNGFNILEESRDWVECFVRWYNTKHKHSRLNYVTPAQHHSGIDGVILSKREKVLTAFRNKNPERWSRKIINCEPIGDVHLNPEKEAA